MTRFLSRGSRFTGIKSPGMVGHLDWIRTTQWQLQGKIWDPLCTCSSVRSRMTGYWKNEFFCAALLAIIKETDRIPNIDVEHGLTPGITYSTISTNQVHGYPNGSYSAGVSRSKRGGCHELLRWYSFEEYGRA
jgi:hypothetical protein